MKESEERLEDLDPQEAKQISQWIAKGQDLQLPVLSPSAEPVRKLTLLEIVSKLGNMDEALADPDFNPEEFVNGLRDKVDHIQYIVGRMETVAEWLKAVATPLAAKAKTMLKNKSRLERYVVAALLTERDNRVAVGDAVDSVSLPGHLFKVRLRVNPPALEIDRDVVKIRAEKRHVANAEDFEKFPGFVTMQRAYVWDHKKIKDALKQGKLPEGLPARLTRGFKADFVPNIPQQLEAKKRKKK